jgi:predicted  nucleic acid-binding Zn-ribbon protein
MIPLIAQVSPILAQVPSLIDPSITPASIILFLAFTLVSVLAALASRINSSAITKKAEAGAIEAVTKAFSGSIDEAKQARQDVLQARVELTDEREKRAKIEGKVESLMTQVTQEKQRADSANERLSKQTNQIEELVRKVGDLTSDINTIRERLAKVEAEKKALEDEKKRLQSDLTTQGEDYRNLMASIQERIDKAVADVKEALRLEYEGRITRLENEIRLRDEEIVNLKALLKESESHEPQNPVSNPADSAGPAAPDSTAPGTGSNGSPASNPDTGNRDGQSSGGSPSA